MDGSRPRRSPLDRRANRCDPRHGARRGSRWLVVLVAAVWALAVPGPAPGEDRLTLAASAGAFDIAHERIPEVGVELRWPTRLVWGLGVMAGVSANRDGGVWAYSGLRRPVELGSRWRVAPSFAVAVYGQGDGKDLGTSLEFRSCLEVAYEWPRRSRVGLSFYHLSNGRLSDVNPGSNSLVLFYGFPVRR